MSAVDRQRGKRYDSSNTIGKVKNEKSMTCRVNALGKLAMFHTCWENVETSVKTLKMFLTVLMYHNAVYKSTKTQKVGLT